MGAVRGKVRGVDDANGPNLRAGRLPRLKVKRLDCAQVLAASAAAAGQYDPGDGRWVWGDGRQAALTSDSQASIVGMAVLTNRCLPVKRR